MKSTLLILGLCSIFAAGVAQAADKCGAAESKAYTDMIGRFNVGEVTMTDVDQARLVYVGSLYQCSQRSEWDREAYCDYSVPLAQLVIAGTQREMRVGDRSQADLDNANAALRQIQKTCK